MTPSELDIHRTAMVMINQHGEAALIEAMKRIEGYRAKGNDNGMRIWNRIADAIEWLQMSENLTGETVH